MVRRLIMRTGCIAMKSMDHVLPARGGTWSISEQMSLLLSIPGLKMGPVAVMFSGGRPTGTGMSGRNADHNLTTSVIGTCIFQAKCDNINNINKGK
jgi:hypothetical protein